MNSTIIVRQIISSQESIIGPIALEQARKVGGLSIDGVGNVTITGNTKDVLTHLVQQYEHLFGQASIEACKDAVKELNPPPAVDELPDILK